MRRPCVLPDVFAFAPTSAAFVRMVITSNNGSGFLTIASESAFEAQATTVPEPSSFVMAGSGVLMGLGYAWRRRRRATA